MKKSLPAISKKLFFLPTCTLLTFTLISLNCRQSSVYKFTGTQLGTVINISIISGSENDAKKASDLAFNEISRIENLMSPYREGADIRNINNNAFKSPVKVSKETYDIINKSIEISAITDGSFDITFATISHLWNFKRKNFIPPDKIKVNELLPFLNYRHIHLDPDKSTVKIDNNYTKIGLGGIAKGYAIKNGIIALKNAGIKNAILEAGGDLKVIGDKYGEAWKIGLRHPRNDTLILSIKLYDKDSVVTSGDYERFAIYGNIRYHHIFDPKTGFPADNFMSVTILSEDPVEADAFATAFFVMGSKKSKELLKTRMDIKVIFIDPDMNVSASNELKNRINLFENIGIEWF